MLKGFITNLGKYNEGKLMGRWVEFPVQDDELAAVFDEIGINEYYEEYFFTDWESYELGDCGLGEFENIDAVNGLADELEAVDIDLIAALIEYGESLKSALEMENNCIFYPNKSMIDVAYEIVDECYELPEIAERYFDYETLARDMKFDGYFESSRGVVYVG